jgi:hypothetical protein
MTLALMQASLVRNLDMFCTILVRDFHKGWQKSHRRVLPFWCGSLGAGAKALIKNNKSDF